MKTADSQALSAAFLLPAEPIVMKNGWLFFYFITKELDNVFLDSPQLKAMERLMTAVPGFRPRGGGVMVHHDFKYTEEMRDCHLCL